MVHIAAFSSGYGTPSNAPDRDGGGRSVAALAAIFRKSIPVGEVTEPVSENQAESRSANNAADREAALILAVVRALPEPYREPLILRLVEGMTGPEIAARTGLTHGSVRVNLYRGMQLLREKLAETAKSASCA